MQIVTLEDQHCVARIDYDPQLVGDAMAGVLHGGVVTSLLDSVGGIAVMAAVGMRQSLATLDLRIDYLRASTPHEPLLADVACTRLTREVAFTSGRAYNGDRDDPVATMAATYMLGTKRLPHALGGSKS
jgi:uncharacterized protein (TIGR00369 family)